jgi:hypothetical protein
MMTIKKIIICSVLCPAVAWAQKDGEIGNEEIIITKERKIVLPSANRILEKIPAEAQNKQPEPNYQYRFNEYKPDGIKDIKTSPKVLPVILDQKTNAAAYSNALKIGAGNYGRVLGEAFLNSDPKLNAKLGLHYLHNTSSIGPVDDLLSANLTSGGEAFATHIAQNYKLGVEGSFNHEKYNYYGYPADIRPYVDATLSKKLQKEARNEAIGFRANKLSTGLNFENISPESSVDFKINTKIKNISIADFAFLKGLSNTDPSINFSPLRELDWASNLQAYFNIIEDQFYAKLEGDVSILQVNNDYGDNILPSDNDRYNRNLYKIMPTFTYFNDFLTITAGLRAINQYQPLENQTSKTYSRGYPVANITYKTAGGLNFTLGLDGDMNRNSLNTLFQENPFLYLSRLKSKIRNTEKPLEVYFAAKGQGQNQLTYNLKANFSQLKDLYFFMNSDFVSEKFDLLYEDQRINVYGIQGETTLPINEYWKTNLQAGYNYYDLKTVEKPFHRPTFDGKWLNTFLVGDKLIATTNFYYRGNVFARNPITTSTEKLPAIYDLNLNIDYLVTKQFSGFVNLNNIFNQKYKSFLFYPAQGFNFVAGLKVQF